MAIQHFNLGPSVVYWDGANIGYSRDGVDVAVDPRWNDIPSDQYGGQGGAPSDSQLLGAIARCSAELTSFEKNIVLRLGSYNPETADLTAGVGEITLPVFGSFVRQGDYPLAKVLEIRGSNGRLKFPVAFLRNPQDMNLGTRATFYSCGWECWVDAAQSRKLYEFLAAI